MTKKINNKNAAAIENYADLMPAFEIPTVEENAETTAAASEVKENVETTVTIGEGIKIDWTIEQAARWLDGAAIDGENKITLIEDSTYKNIEKHEKWRPTYSVLTEKGKMARVGKNFGDWLIKHGAATVRVIGEYKAEKAAEKEKAKAEKAAARQAKKAQKAATKKAAK